MNAVVEHKPEEKSAYDRLQRRERRFVDAYVEGKTGAEAIRGARYKAVRDQKPGWGRNRAWELLQRPEIRAAIEERERHAVAEAGIRHLSVVRELHWLATCDPRKLVNGEGVQIPLHELPADIAACISAVEIENISYNDETGTRYKYKFWDKNKALDKLGQYLKLWDSKGPTVNVDARSVTVNSSGGPEALQGALRLLGQVKSLGPVAAAAPGDPDGPVLPAPVRVGPQ